MALGIALASENMIMRGEEEEEEEQGRHVSAECLFFLKPFFRSV
jgi:hypothetical protein